MCICIKRKKKSTDNEPDCRSMINGQNEQFRRINTPGTVWEHDIHQQIDYR